jgi:predicted heme/steroid binding protein
MKLIRNILFLFIFASFFLLSVTKSLAQTQVFTPETLAQFDGLAGRKAYFAYEGKVYDVTESALWKEGQHYGLKAGVDLTGKLDGAPHGTEVFSRVPLMGTYQGAVAPPSATPVPQATPAPATPTTQRAWYEAPIRIAGLSILSWSGIILAVLFVLNFATCFSMPWSQNPLPWKGGRPGPDPLDVAPDHMRFTTIHKYFAWATVVTGIIHGVLGLLQLLGYRL